MRYKLQMGRFGRDVVWNLVSTGFLAVAGLVLHFGIGRYYGPETYGVFCQVYAIYIVLSQLAVGGFVFSVLSQSGEYAHDKSEVRSILSSALVLTIVLSSAVCVLTFLLRTSIAALLESAEVAAGLLWILPGLWCLAINKVLIFTLNGLRHMRLFAIAQATRYLLILSIAVAMIGTSAPGHLLPAVFSGAELTLLPFLLIYFWRSRLLSLRAIRARWLRRHVAFGTKAFTSGLLADANSRVDILMLGYFRSDAIVGVYGFAAMLAEGFAQIVIAVQSNVSPILSDLRSRQRMPEAKALLRKVSLWLCPALATIGLIATIAFPAVVRMITENADLADGWIYFAILMTGISAAAGYTAVAFILNQWGHPGWFSGYLAVTIMTNVLLNALLIPRFGALGAASATALTTILTIAYLKILTRRVAGIEI